jgi:hypothetical protein
MTDLFSISASFSLKYIMFNSLLIYE